MKREDLLVPNNSAFHRKSTNPATMSSGQQEHCHGPTAHPAVTESVRHETDPRTGRPLAHRVGSNSDLLQHNPDAVARRTHSESLQPTDPRTNKSFWAGVLDQAKRALGIGE
jgi:hypothetical protein